MSARTSATSIGGRCLVFAIHSSVGTNRHRRSGRNSATGVPFLVTMNVSLFSTARSTALKSLRSSRWLMVRTVVL